MKRLFFSKSSKIPPSVNNDLIAQTPTLPPKFVVPPVPHPRPHEHIAILPTKEGLFLRPHTPFQGEPDSHYVRITWGKVPEIVEFQGVVQNTDTNWAAAVIVYGIVGILELFAGWYLISTPPFTQLHNLNFVCRIVSTRHYVQVGRWTQ
jgi:phosphatidylinositol 4-phosphatase